MSYLTTSRFPGQKRSFAEMSEAAAANILAEQFDDLEQQHEAAKLGMWIFLATEVLSFLEGFLSLTRSTVISHPRPLPPPAGTPKSSLAAPTLPFSFLAAR
ncbi:MAG: hypothetical protein ABIU29_04605 [Chthoniobacterales bacterium]